MRPGELSRLREDDNVKAVTLQYHGRLVQVLCCEWALRHWTHLVIVKDQYSHLVYPNVMHKITNL